MAEHKATERISARVTPATKRKLEADAARLDVKMSAYLTMLIHLRPLAELNNPDVGKRSKHHDD